LYETGRERGLSAELARDFERYINKRYASQLGKRPVTLYLIPTTRDKLLTGLTAGLGDISAGNLTVTAEREKLVDFAAPRDRTPVRELIVTGSKAPPIATLGDLAGKQVYVRKATSYYESLMALNDRFKAAGKPPMQITLLPDALEDEDKAGDGQRRRAQHRRSRRLESQDVGSGTAAHHGP
jgi:ABC-type amino acid transport substrate-binding protein